MKYCELCLRYQKTVQQKDFEIVMLKEEIASLKNELRINKSSLNLLQENLNEGY